MGSVLSSGFLSMKRLRVLLLPPEWDASPSWGYPQHICWYHLYTWVQRSTVRLKCLAKEHNRVLKKPQLVEGRAVGYTQSAAKELNSA